MAEQRRRYKAFISYSQKDKRAAMRLHKALEAYRVPQGVDAGGIDPKSRRLGRFFRDDEEMGAASSLGSALEGAIADSENLIVVCSPNSAKSQWVNQEILHFRQTGRAENIFAVIISGAANASQPKLECFPPALRTPEEPLGLDARREGRPRLIARLAAGLVRTPFDALWRRERRRRTAAAVRFSLAGLTVTALLALGGLGILHRTNLTLARSLVVASREDASTDEQQLRFAILSLRVAPDREVRDAATERLSEILAHERPGFYLMRSMVHGDQVSDAAFSPDGTRVVTACADGAARIWDAVSGRELATLRSLGGILTSVAFSPDASRIAAGSIDRTARIWDAQSGRELAVLRGHNALVASVAFSPDGMLILTTSGDETARVWDVASAREIVVLSDAVNASFSPDGARVVTTSQEGTARVWDLASGRQIAAWRAQGDQRGSTFVNSHFSPDGRAIVSNSRDSTARVWDPTSGRELAVLRGHEAIVSNVSFSPDGARIVTASLDGSARLWDAMSGREIAALRGQGCSLDDAVFSLDAARIVTTCSILTSSDNTANPNTAQVWDARTGDVIAVLRGHEGNVFSAAFSSKGDIVTASADGTARIWKSGSAREVVAVRGFSPAFSPEGTRIVTMFEDDNVARVWDTGSGREISTLRGHTDVVTSAAFSADGTRIVTASADRTARIWDTVSARQLMEFRGHEATLRSSVFSRDGRRILTTSTDQTARIWDVASGRELAALRGRECNPDGAAFSSGGARVVTYCTFTGTESDRNKAHLWDAASGREIAALGSADSSVHSAAFSADGTRVVTASRDSIGRVWDAVTGRELLALRGHGDALQSAAFSPDGRLIVTASNDETARVWDASNGRQLLLLRGTVAGGFMSDATFTPDGALIVTMDSGRVVQVWDARSGRQIASIPIPLWNAYKVLVSSDGAHMATSTDTTVVWNTAPLLHRGEQLEHMPYLARLVCDPSTGRLNGGRSVITQSDAEAAPVLRTRVGEDVCAQSMRLVP